MNILSTILFYVIVILVFLFTLTIHELAHLLVGIKNKVNVKEFCIGFGPTIFQKISKKNNIKIKVKLIPLLGYVLFDSFSLRKDYENEKDDPDYEWFMTPTPKGKIKLEETKLGSYIWILSSGIIINLIMFFFLWIFYWLAYHLNGYQATNPFILLGRALLCICEVIIFKKPDLTSIYVQYAELSNITNFGLTIITLFMLINILSSLFNIIPLPPLDGYKIFSRIYQEITNKQIESRIENTLALVTTVFMYYAFFAGLIASIWGW